MCEHLLAVFFNPEEVIALADQLHRPVVRRAEITGQQLLVSIETLAIDAVEALVIAEIDISPLMSPREHLLHELLVHRIGGSHPEVDGGVAAGCRGDVQTSKRFTEDLAHLVGIDFGLKTLSKRGAANLVAMFIGATEERNPIMAELTPQRACEGVGRQCFVSAADVRSAVAVKNRSSYMDSLAHCH